MPRTTTLGLIRPRIRLADAVFIGPGKIELLRSVAEQGSISAAARAQGMGYKRAWHLLNELNTACATPAVTSSVGGSGGGGAQLTELGRALLMHYDAIEQASAEAAAPHLKKLQRRLSRGA